MKLVEFYGQQTGADRNDPLLSIVKNLETENAKLKGPPATDSKFSDSC